MLRRASSPAHHPTTALGSRPPAQAQGPLSASGYGRPRDDDACNCQSPATQPQQPVLTPSDGRHSNGIAAPRTLPTMVISSEATAALSPLGHSRSDCRLPPRDQQRTERRSKHGSVLHLSRSRRSSWFAYARTRTRRRSRAPCLRRRPRLARLPSWAESGCLERPRRARRDCPDCVNPAVSRRASIRWRRGFGGAFVTA